MRVYVSGPMTGRPELNYPLFNATAAALRKQGHEVCNPAEAGLPEGATWSDYMRADIALLVTCDAIVMLPDWHESKGARLEITIARKLGLTALQPPNQAQ